MVEATVTAKHQITIPKSIRNKFQIRRGDVLSFAESANGQLVIERKARNVSMSDVAGKLKPKRKLLSVAEEQAAAQAICGIGLTTKCTKGKKTWRSLRS